MEQQQGIVYPLELFSTENMVRLSATCNTVSEANERKELQIIRAGQQERALAYYSEQVELFEETAVYESTHGGVRGRGSNPPTYSIILFC